jgi:hypothetical protein
MTKLERLRDELAQSQTKKEPVPLVSGEIATSVFRSEYEHYYCRGFDVCKDILMPEIGKLLDALQWYVGDEREAFYKKATEARASWRAFIEGETE